MSISHAVLKARIFLTIFIWLNATVFIKFFWDSSAAFMLGWYLYKGGVYLKSNLFLANNSMVTDHFHFKNCKHVLVFVLKVIFYMVLNFRICMLILLQFILNRKILCWTCFINIRTGTFKRICVWFTQNFNYNQGNDCCVLFESIMGINTTWWCGVYSKASVINISALKCSIYLRKALIN